LKTFFCNTESITYVIENLLVFLRDGFPSKVGINTHTQKSLKTGQSQRKCSSLIIQEQGPHSAGKCKLILCACVKKLNPVLSLVMTTYSRLLRCAVSLYRSIVGLYIFIGLSHSIFFVFRI
jgi:hypothetical protein